MVGTRAENAAQGKKVLTLGILLAAGLLALITGVGPAEAAFPGENGKIAFRSDRDGDAEIFAMNPDGSNQTKLTNNAAFDGSPVFSSDGKRIAFRSDRDRFGEIYVMDDSDNDGDGNGDNSRRLTNNAAFDDDPTISPDGQKIAFVSNRDGGNFEIYVMDVADANNDGNGDNQIRLTDDASLDREPAFSPDGSKIAFRSNRDGDDEIWVIDIADPSNPERLTKNTGSASADFQPAWSPDGSRIAFASNRDFGNVEVYVMDAVDEDNDGNGDNPIQLTDTESPISDSQPAFSPDGTEIAFTSNRAGGGNTSPSDVYVMDAAPESSTNQPQQHTDNGAFDGDSDWQPIDTTPPNTTITSSGPSGTIKETSANFTFSSSEPDGATFQCSLDSAPFGDCTSPQEYNNLGDGQHTFQVQATDRAGNTDASPDSRAWTVDATPPNTSISKAPENPTSESAPTFEFSSNDPDASFECRLARQGDEPGSFESCASPKTYPAQGGGNYTFEVKAKDAVGNTGPAASHTWTVDAIPPTVADNDGDGRSLTPPKALGGNIKIEFSEDMDPGSLMRTPLSQPSLSDTVRLFKGSARVSAKVKCLDPACRTALLDPKKKLAAGTKYAVRIEGGDADGVAGVADVAGNEMASDFAASFKTKGR